MVNTYELPISSTLNSDEKMYKFVTSMSLVSFALIMGCIVFIVANPLYEMVKSLGGFFSKVLIQEINGDGPYTGTDFISVVVLALALALGIYGYTAGAQQFSTAALCMIAFYIVGFISIKSNKTVDAALKMIDASTSGKSKSGSNGFIKSLGAMNPFAKTELSAQEKQEQKDKEVVDAEARRQKQKMTPEELARQTSSDIVAADKKNKAELEAKKGTAKFFNESSVIRDNNLPSTIKNAAIGMGETIVNAPGVVARSATNAVAAARDTIQKNIDGVNNAMRRGRG